MIFFFFLGVDFDCTILVFLLSQRKHQHKHAKNVRDRITIGNNVILYIYVGTWHLVIKL